MSESFSAADIAVAGTSKCLQDITNTLVMCEEHHLSTPYHKCLLSDDEDLVDVCVKPVVDECNLDVLYDEYPVIPVLTSTASRLHHVDKNDRRAQLGLSFTEHCSFEANQSYPKMNKIDRDVLNSSMQDFLVSGDSIDDISYTRSHFKDNSTSESPGTNRSSANCSFLSYFGHSCKSASSRMAVLPNSVCNPNKAVVTVDSKTTEILIANDVACQLFGLDHNTLVGSCLRSMLKLQSEGHESLPESHLELTGEILQISGKVVNAIDSKNLVLPVSVWVKKLDTSQPRCLVVMEAVEQSTGWVVFDYECVIKQCSSSFSYLFGYNLMSELVNWNITHLIPSFSSLNLPPLSSDTDKEENDFHISQPMTGRTKFGVAFPLSLDITTATDGDGGRSFHGFVRVFSTISGLITVQSDGIINNINNSFALTLLGYDSAELVNQNIQMVMPYIFDDMAWLPHDTIDKSSFNDSNKQDIEVTNDQLIKHGRFITSELCDRVRIGPALVDSQLDDSVLIAEPVLVGEDHLVGSQSDESVLIAEPVLVGEDHLVGSQSDESVLIAEPVLVGEDHLVGSQSDESVLIAEPVLVGEDHLVGSQSDESVLIAEPVLVGEDHLVGSQSDESVLIAEPVLVGEDHLVGSQSDESVLIAEPVLVGEDHLVGSQSDESVLIAEPVLVGEDHLVGSQSDESVLIAEPVLVGEDHLVGSQSDESVLIAEPVLVGDHHRTNIFNSNEDNHSSRTDLLSDPYLGVRSVQAKDDFSKDLDLIANLELLKDSLSNSLSAVPVFSEEGLSNDTILDAKRASSISGLDVEAALLLNCLRHGSNIEAELIQLCDGLSIKLNLDAEPVLSSNPDRDTEVGQLKNCPSNDPFLNVDPVQLINRQAKEHDGINSSIEEECIEVLKPRTGEFKTGSGISSVVSHGMETGFFSCLSEDCSFTERFSEASAVIRDFEPDSLLRDVHDSTTSHHCQDGAVWHYVQDDTVLHDVRAGGVTKDLEVDIIKCGVEAKTALEGVEGDFLWPSCANVLAKFSDSASDTESEGTVVMDASDSADNLIQRLLNDDNRIKNNLLKSQTTGNMNFQSDVYDAADQSDSFDLESAVVDLKLAVDGGMLDFLNESLDSDSEINEQIQQIMNDWSDHEDSNSDSGDEDDNHVQDNNGEQYKNDVQDNNGKQYNNDVQNIQVEDNLKDSLCDCGVSLLLELSKDEDNNGKHCNNDVMEYTVLHVRENNDGDRNNSIGEHNDLELNYCKHLRTDSRNHNKELYDNETVEQCMLQQNNLECHQWQIDLPSSPMQVERHLVPTQLKQSTFMTQLEQSPCKGHTEQSSCEAEVRLATSKTQLKQSSPFETLVELSRLDTEQVSGHIEATRSRLDTEQVSGHNEATRSRLDTDQIVSLSNVTITLNIQQDSVSNSTAKSRSTLESSSSSTAKGSSSPKSCSTPSHVRMCQETFSVASSSKSDCGSIGMTDEKAISWREGMYSSICKHKDGTELSIVYQVRCVQLNNGQSLYCVWVSRDPERSTQLSHCPFSADVTASESLNSNSSHRDVVSPTSLHSTHSESVQKCEDPVNVNKDTSWAELAVGNEQYDSLYETLHCIGRGAFGYVKLAQHRLSRSRVVVKFIRKCKVLDEYWITSQQFGRLPFEVYVLLTLNHPNIVKVLDHFEGTQFIEMVMEKHGAGIDLFEFIEGSPVLPEPVCSYMFRQLVSALTYLHSRQIVHRDIKDENVIVDESFNIKLIDFGSAALFDDTPRFATFCGTMEYCSPEVLQGNRYRGPELEMWSLGVTLYTLVFGENPFMDVQQTIEAFLSPPFEPSSDLMNLILWLLEPDLTNRATIFDLECDVWTHQPIVISHYKFNEIFSKDNQCEEGSVAAGPICLRLSETDFCVKKILLLLVQCVLACRELISYEDTLILPAMFNAVIIIALSYTLYFDYILMYKLYYHVR